ncbi:helix-turn-helix domain-containing protein [Sphingomonas sp. BK481]|uniref:helix-turn-helix domain-containing protein n=1 Tax=Sphingomonas sp. BK481 TaxID=2586981 RepID=UPI00161689C6|nr:helix-turn-helix domain-containing protein [Sphingomonas sp. BK481]MBB3588938.1 hypothetical protein [Sphingomonas sp. BK481]
MGFTLQRSMERAGSIVDELRAEGIDDLAIQMALDHQEAQRGAGVPVYPLRVICGLDQLDRRTDRSVGQHALALAVAPRNRPGKGGLHITREPVWAKSIQTGSDAEASFPVRLTTATSKAIMNAAYRGHDLGLDACTAARRDKRELTKEEQKLAALTPSGLKILRRLLQEAHYRKGWVMPAYETIAAWTKLGRSTVIRQLKALAAIGLTEWVRRFDYECDREKGSRSKQTSNLYRFALPRWLAKFLKIDAPIPDDERTRREIALEDHAVMLAQTPEAERKRLMPTDAPSRAPLIIAAYRHDRRSLREQQARECHGGTEPQDSSLYMEVDMRNRPSRPMSRP